MSVDTRYLDQADPVGHRLTLEGFTAAPLISLNRSAHPDQAYRDAHPKSRRRQSIVLDRATARALRDGLDEWLDDENVGMVEPCRATHVDNCCRHTP